MGRALGEFKGRGVVIGCSNFNNSCQKQHIHQGEDNFYTIDMDPNKRPDLIFDVTSDLPEDFKSRFQLTYLECLDYTAYNDDPLSKLHKRKYGGIQGFQNIWDMTSENGFILINGCPREKMFRRQISIRQLHYIELDTAGECILVAKNQQLSFDEVVQEIEHLDPALKKTIDYCKTIWGAEPNPKSGFFDLEYDNLPCMRADIIGMRGIKKEQQNNLFFKSPIGISFAEWKIEEKQYSDYEYRR